MSGKEPHNVTVELGGIDESLQDILPLLDEALHGLGFYYNGHLEIEDSDGFHEEN